ASTQECRASMSCVCVMKSSCNASMPNSKLQSWLGCVAADMEASPKNAKDGGADNTSIFRGGRSGCNDKLKRTLQCGLPPPTVETILCSRSGETGERCPKSHDFG